MKSSWAFKARKESDEQLCLDIYDTIGSDPLFGGGLSAKSVLDFFSSPEHAKAKSTLVRINSAGGIVTEGLAIYNILKQSKTSVTTRVDALAGSISSIIAMAGGTLEMAEHSYLMIHNPYGWIEGGAGELRHQADVLDSMRQEMVAIYCAKSGKGPDFIGALMDEETWITATQALAYGLCDRIIPDSNVKLAAHFDLSQFRNTPRSLDPERQAVAFTLTADNLTDAVRQALATVADETTPVVVATEPTTTQEPTAAQTAASGEPTMDEQVYKDQIAALEAKVAELTAALASESSARAQAEADAAEAKAKFPKKGDKDDDEEDDEEMAATRSVVAEAMELTGCKDVKKLRGALMGYADNINSRRTSQTVSERVEALFKSGKIRPTAKAKALKMTHAELDGYVEMLGDATVGPVGAPEHEPDPAHPVVAAARLASAPPAFDPETVQLDSAERAVVKQMGANDPALAERMLTEKRAQAKAAHAKKFGGSVAA